VKVSCDPIYQNSQLTNVGITKNLNGVLLTGTDVAIPCGLIAKSYFNDTYSLTNGDGTNVDIDSNGIAW